MAADITLVERLPGSWKIKDGQALADGVVRMADLPACTESRRGERRAVNGSPGISDGELICLWDGTSYDWVARGPGPGVGIGPPGPPGPAGSGGTGSGSLVDILMLGGM